MVQVPWDTIFFAYIQIVSRTLVLLKFALATTCLAILEKGVSEKPVMSSFRRFLMEDLLMHMLQTLQLNQPCLWALHSCIRQS